MNDNNIKPYSFFATIAVTTIGVGIFSLPRALAKNVGTDGWLVVLIAGVITMILSSIICRVVELNNYESFSNILVNNFGRFFSKIIAFIFVIYSIFTISVQMRVFVEVVKMYLLEKTPTEFLLIMTILVGAYAVGIGENALFKFNEISFWFMFLPIILVFVVLIKGADFTNILPIGQNSMGSYGKEILESIAAFGGFEIIFFIAPFLNNKNNMKKYAKKSIMFVTLFYVLAVVFTIAIFTKSETSKMLWPTITMVTSIDIPGAFIERWEGIIMSIWILFYFTTFVNIYYFSSVIIKESFKISQEKIGAVILMPLIYGVALYSKNISELTRIDEEILNNLILMADIAIPLILLIISKIRSRKGGKKIEKKKA